MFPVERHAVFGPQPFYQLDSFDEPRPALCLRYAEALELDIAIPGTNPCDEVRSEGVESRHLFGDLDRVVER